LPVRQVGQDCYQWGNQKVYCGTDAKRKAILQGIAIENTGWKEAEEIDVTTPSFPFPLPNEFNETRDFYIHEGYLLISADSVGKYRIWDLDNGGFLGWNIISKGNPVKTEYEDKYSLTHPEVEQFDTLSDARTYAKWRADRRIKAVEDFFNPDSGHGYLSTMTAMALASPAKRGMLKMKMTNTEIRDGRHPNRGQDWIPNRIQKEWAKEISKKLPCPTCGKKVFVSLSAAERHHFYCEKYGSQPQNQLYFTPFEVVLIQEGITKRLPNTPKEAEMIHSSNILYLLGGVTLGILIPLFLDSRANKV